MSQSDNECSSSPVTNLSYDDGDEELLESVEESVKNSDVNLEPLESVENVSSMSDCDQSVEQGENLVGSRIKVWWSEDKSYREGVVKSFNSRIKKHEVLYDFGAEELLTLRPEQWELVEDVSPVSDRAQSVEHGESLAESSVKVLSSVTKIDHQGVVKSVDTIKNKHKLLIDDYNDGDEEFLDVKREPCELVENVSPISDCLQSGIICVHEYKVKQSVAPILESIFKKHGDIAAECVFKSVSVRSSLLEVICEVVRQIQTDSITEKTKEIECQVSDAEAANINVSWIRAHFEGICKRKEGTKKSSLLMETKGTTILVKKAAQMDLRERSEELLVAQERFVKAERCVRVLDLVEKKPSNNILETKAEKDSWVEQPILD